MRGLGGALRTNTDGPGGARVQTEAYPARITQDRRADVPRTRSDVR